MAFKTPSEVAATAVGMGVAKSRASSGALTVLGFLELHSYLRRIVAYDLVLAWALGRPQRCENNLRLAVQPWDSHGNSGRR